MSRTSSSSLDSVIRNYTGILCHLCIVRIPRKEFDKHYFETHFNSENDILFCGEHMMPLRTRRAIRRHMPCLRKESRQSIDFRCHACGYRCVSSQYVDSHIALLHKTLPCSSCNYGIWNGYSGLMKHRKRCIGVPSQTVNTFLYRNHCQFLNCNFV
uniref:C2H2-type domain-containing protein n=1 Tax=Trichuris muris TaxID=70415 RepID=A0A5S6QGL9_TRIMR